MELGADRVLPTRASPAKRVLKPTMVKCLDEKRMQIKQETNERLEMLADSPDTSNRNGSPSIFILSSSPSQPFTLETMHQLTWRHNRPGRNTPVGIQTLVPTGYPGPKRQRRRKHRPETPEGGAYFSRPLELASRDEGTGSPTVFPSSQGVPSLRAGSLPKMLGVSEIYRVHSAQPDTTASLGTPLLSTIYTYLV